MNKSEQFVACELPTGVIINEFQFVGCRCRGGGEGE